MPQIRAIEQSVKRLTRAANRAKKLAEAAAAAEAEEFFDAPTGAPETGAASASGASSSVSSTPVDFTPASLVTPSASSTLGDTPGARSPLASLETPSAPPVSLLCRVFDAVLMAFGSG